MEKAQAISEELKSDVLVLKVNGKLDGALSPVIEKYISTYIEKGTSKFLIDFSNVTSLTGSGLSLLIALKKQIKSLSGTLMVCSLRSDVLEMVKICGFDHVLDIAKTEADALAKFKKPKALA